MKKLKSKKLNPVVLATTETPEGASANSEQGEDTLVTLEDPATPMTDVTDTESLTDLVKEVGELAMHSPAPGTSTDGQEYVTVKKKLSGSQRRKMRREVMEIPPKSDAPEVSKKRRNEEGSNTPSPVVKKKQKVVQRTVSYAGIASNYKLALIPTDYPDCGFTMEHFKGLNALTMKRAKEHYLAKGWDFSINIDGAYMDGGAIIVNCLDENTKKWLETDMKGVMLGGKQIRTAELAELTPTVRAGLFVPGEKMEAKELLSLISNQNTMEIQGWIVLGQQARETGHFVTLKLPERDCQRIKEKMNGRLSLGIYKLNLIEMKKKVKETSVTTEPIPCGSKGGNVDTGKSEPKEKPKSSEGSEMLCGAGSGGRRPVSGRGAEDLTDLSPGPPGSEPAQTPPVDRPQGRITPPEDD